MTSELSLLKPLGYQCNRRCGYCKSSDGSRSYYLSCDDMRVDHYQELVDRGWRRSGTLYYKPDLKRQCCPHYTIRLEASQFVSKKEQRRAVNHFNDHVLGLEYKRKLAILRPRSREEKRRTRDKFDLCKAVHAAEHDNIQKPVDPRSKLVISPVHKFEVSLESDSFTKEKHQVFLKYQIQIHQDPASRWHEESFKRFLCDGLTRRTLKLNGQIMKLGSYHQCYRLNGRLIAVGVLDLLPHAVSSVYLFYDPEFAQWDFGKLSAMREIALAVEGKYEYYYMGYYIHTCVKMRYKGRFAPSNLLDPETLQWNLFDDTLRQKLDQHKYVAPSSEQADGDSAQIEAKESSLATSQAVNDPQCQGPTPVGPQTIREDDDAYEIDSIPSDQEDTEIPEGSLFDHNVPGVLKKEEVAQLDLSHWKLVVRDMVVDLEDLRGWENQRIDDPNSIKGIVAELVAATGPALLKSSAVVLF